MIDDFRPRRSMHPTTSTIMNEQCVVQENMTKCAEHQLFQRETPATLTARTAINSKAQPHIPHTFPKVGKRNPTPHTPPRKSANVVDICSEVRGMFSSGCVIDSHPSVLSYEKQFCFRFDVLNSRDVSAAATFSPVGMR